jgi:ribosome-associated protein
VRGRRDPDPAARPSVRVEPVARDATIPAPMPRDIAIRGDTIRLGQLLKLAGIADSGGEARALVERGGVRVNGEVETRRGRQLRPGDEIAAPGECVRVV